MKKTKITQEQAEALEQVKETRGKDKVMNGVLGKWYRESEPLNDLTPSQMARALYIGYEVEPEFKENDWIIDGDGELQKIKEVTPSGVHLSPGWMGRETDNYKNSRLATPKEIAEGKERRFFAESGREPWELRRKDLLVINDMYDSIQDIYDGVYIFESGFDLDESDLETLVKRGNVKVACFADDRKDVDNG